MNIKFFKSCYDLAALSTCVQENAEKKLWNYQADSRVDFSDNFHAITKYEVLCSDYMSLKDYEIHEFYISFVRDGKEVESYKFEKKIDRTNVGSLANPKLDLDKKLAAIKAYRPKGGLQLDIMLKKTQLTNEEINMVMKKNEEIFNEIVRKQQNQQVKR